MMQTFQAVSGLDWVGEAPVVVDRAMGHTCQVRGMAATGPRFLTSLTRPEFCTYAPRLPWSATEGLSGTASADEASRRVEAAGMEKVEESLFVLDLGVTALPEDEEAAARSRPEVADEDPTVHAMRLGRQVHQAVADGRHFSHAAAGAALGLKKGVLGKYERLLGLTEDLQRLVLEGKASGRSLAELIRLAQLDGETQPAAFEALLRKIPRRKIARRQEVAEGSLPAEEPRPSGSGGLTVRVVAYFNPERFVEQRQKGAERLDRIAEFVEALNKKLASPRSRHTRDKVVAEIDRRLHRDDMVELFEVEVEEGDIDGRRCLQARLTLRAEEWGRRRRYDGFSVLVGHEKLGQPAPDLCRLYRRKDMVEKDFQVIKSVLELHAVRHHSDLKVRAHVTLCMLALLLERSLNEKLGGLSTADEALESLESCRLNL